MRSEHEDCCVLMAARRVDHNALNKENIRLTEQLEKAYHDLEETKADFAKSKEATRSFLGPHSSAMSALVIEWWKVTSLADDLQTAIDYVDQDKTVAWYKTSDLEKAFKEMQKHTDFLRDETERIRDRLRTEVAPYWPHYCASSEAKQTQDASDVELSFEEQQQKLEKLFCVSYQTDGTKARNFRRKHTPGS